MKWKQRLFGKKFKKPKEIWVTWLLCLSIFLFMMGSYIKNAPILASLSLSFGMVGLTAAFALMALFIGDHLK